MLIGYINRGDSPSILSAGSQVSTLPVGNLQDPFVSKKWRTTSTVVSTHVLITMDTQYSIRVISLLGTNLTSNATIRIRASNTDTTATSGDILDTGSVSAGIDDDYKNVYYVLNSDITARYWRVDIEDLTLSTYIEIGRLFIGPAWIPSKSALYGWANDWIDESNTSKSLGGQTFINVRARRRVLTFTLSFMDEDEMYNNAFEIARRNGLNKDILVMMKTTGSRISEQSIFGLVNRSVPLTHQTLNVFMTRYTIEERL